MTTPNALKKHPTLLYTEDIKSLCKTLEYLGITVFSHLKVFDGNRLTVLCNHPKSLVNYVQKKYYEADPCVNIKREKSDIGQYIMWDNVNCSGKTAAMLADSTSLDFRHVFTIIKNIEGTINFYHFGTHHINSSMNQLYINNLDLLDRFISYFNAQIEQSKVLASAYDIAINDDQKKYCVMINDNGGFDERLQEKRQMCLRAMLTADLPNLTAKEFACVKQLLQGKTAKEIAGHFGLSYRTIEDRIGNLKCKLNASSKAELIAKCRDLMLYHRS